MTIDDTSVNPSQHSRNLRSASPITCSLSLIGFRLFTIATTRRAHYWYGCQIHFNTARPILSGVRRCLDTLRSLEIRRELLRWLMETWATVSLVTTSLAVMILEARSIPVIMLFAQFSPRYTSSTIGAGCHHRGTTLRTSSRTVWWDIMQCMCLITCQNGSEVCRSDSHPH